MKQTIIFWLITFYINILYSQNRCVLYPTKLTDLLTFFMDLDIKYYLLQNYMMESTTGLYFLLEKKVELRIGLKAEHYKT